MISLAAVDSTGGGGTARSLFTDVNTAARPAVALLSAPAVVTTGPVQASQTARRRELAVGTPSSSNSAAIAARAADSTSVARAWAAARAGGQPLPSFTSFAEAGAPAATAPLAVSSPSRAPPAAPSRGVQQPRRDVLSAPTSTVTAPTTGSTVEHRVRVGRLTSTTRAHAASSPAASPGAAAPRTEWQSAAVGTSQGVAKTQADTARTAAAPAPTSTSGAVASPSHRGSVPDMSVASALAAARRTQQASATAAAFGGSAADGTAEDAAMPTAASKGSVTPSALPRETPRHSAAAAAEAAVRAAGGNAEGVAFGRRRRTGSTPSLGRGEAAAEEDPSLGRGEAAAEEDPQQQQQRQQQQQQRQQQVGDGGSASASAYPATSRGAQHGAPLPPLAPMPTTARSHRSAGGGGAARGRASAAAASASASARAAVVGSSTWDVAAADASARAAASARADAEAESSAAAAAAEAAAAEFEAEDDEMLAAEGKAALAAQLAGLSSRLGHLKSLFFTRGAAPRLPPPDGLLRTPMGAVPMRHLFNEGARLVYIGDAGQQGGYYGGKGAAVASPLKQQAENAQVRRRRGLLIEQQAVCPYITAPPAVARPQHTRATAAAATPTPPFMSDHRVPRLVRRAPCRGGRARGRVAGSRRGERQATGQAARSAAAAAAAAGAAGAAAAKG